MKGGTRGSTTGAPGTAATDPSADRPFVSVVVPTYRERRLEHCLEALAQQSYKEYEVIVVNNDPSDPLDQVRRDHPWVRFFEEAEPGSYAARNRGIHAAKGAVIAFTDSDCVPARRWIENGVAALEQRETCGLVAGRMETVPLGERGPTLGELYDSVVAFPQATYAQKGYSAGGNAFTYRSLLEEVGGFDNSLFSGGDRDLGRKIVEAGYEVVYAEDARIVHPARQLGEILSKNRRIMQGTRKLHKIWRWPWHERTYYAALFLLPPVSRWRVLWNKTAHPVPKKIGVCAIALLDQYHKAWCYLTGGKRQSRS